MPLLFAFQTNTHYYMVEEFINGGEVFTLLQKKGRFSDKRVRFYTAEIICALEYLHTGGVMYRDLKTENILLDAEGHIRLTDFGVSKGELNTRERGRTKTMVHGTMEYMAPEMFQSEKYGFSIDWYSLGLVIYEMLTGGEHPYKN
jgi:serum/glucocorticoid-regulated kinase 2